MITQTLITQKAQLLNANGELIIAGWSPQPLLDCNLEQAKFYSLRFLQKLRIKRWDYYGITTPTHFFSFTISDIGYLGMVFAYVVDFEQKTHHEETLSLPFGGGVQLPRNNEAGQTTYQNENVSLTFSAGPALRHIAVQWKNFEKGQDLNAEIDLDLQPDHQSMNIVIPIEKRRFYYNRKINCMPASGWVEYLGNKHTISPDSCLGNLDWGRGVWAYDSFWVWASASGFSAAGQKVGLNLGYGFGDTSAATENAIILDGKIHKLGNVKFRYSNNNFMQPWYMQSDDGRMLLTFKPFFERVAKTDMKILFSEVHQMFGVYSGSFVTENGETIQIKELTGFAEEHHARW